jgi:type IV secretion system protein VirB4
MAAAEKTLSVFSKKKREVSAKELEAFKDISDDVIESDFVPYACLFDASTIATKDAELLQTIKITGSAYDGHAEGNLRSAIRQAIKHCIPDTSYAIWLHTLRRKLPAVTRAHYPDGLSGKIDESWRLQQPGGMGFTNELYITLVHASDEVTLKNKQVLRQSFGFRRDAEKRLDTLEARSAELRRASEAFLKILEPFGPRLLTTVKRDGVYYNEQIEFLEKLINLEERPMPVPERDLSHELTSGEITFGYNAMEVRTAAGVRRFAAILTLKDYKESTLSGIDKFLEIPCELIVSQCFDFTGAEQAREAYEKQSRYLRYSSDRELAKWMEIDRLMEQAPGDKRMAYGQQQTTILLISPGVNQLESNVRMVQRALNRLGLIVVREDLRFEECYWSQLPANFPFITRRQAVDTDHIAGFVNLQAAPMGNATGSPWGAPITVFHTVQDTPYYFNYHRQQLSHTLLLGNRSNPATPLAHFLLAQTRKLPVAIWYLDTRGHGSVFMQALGGRVVTPGTPDCKLNPLLLPETPANRDFLALWVATLIDPSGVNISRAMLSYFQSTIDGIFQLPREQRRMSTLVAMVRQADGMLASQIQRYASGGAYGDLFDMPEDNFSVDMLSCWNLSRWMGDVATRGPLTSYLLHRLTAMLNGTPTLLVLDEAFRIFETPLFASRMATWCDHLSKSNASAMMLTEDVEMSATYAHANVASQKAATLFAMPERQPGAGYAMGFGLAQEDINTLSFLAGEHGQVLQKRGLESRVLRADMSVFPSSIAYSLRGVLPPVAAAPSAADTLAALMGMPASGVA